MIYREEMTTNSSNKGKLRYHTITVFFFLIIRKINWKERHQNNK